MSTAERMAKADPVKDKQHLYDTFAEFDQDKNGSLSCRELRHVMKHVGLRDVQVKQLFEEIDANRDGEISIVEFVNWLFADTKEASSAKKYVYRTESVKEGLNEFMEAVQDLMEEGTESTTLTDIFASMDHNGNKQINLSEFIAAAHSIGVRMDHQMLKKIFDEIDTERKKLKKKKAPKLKEGWDQAFTDAGVDSGKHLGPNVDAYAVMGVPNLEANDTRYCGSIEKKQGKLIHSRHGEYEEVLTFTDPKTGKKVERRRKVNEGGVPDKLISFAEFEKAFASLAGGEKASE